MRPFCASTKFITASPCSRPTAPASTQHINHQVATGDDVMRSFYFLSERQVPQTGWSSSTPQGCARSLTNCFIVSDSFRLTRKDSANGAPSRRSRSSVTERSAMAAVLQTVMLEEHGDGSV